MKNSDELLSFAACPACSEGMLVIPNELVGIPVDSEGIVKEGIRGL